MKNYYEILEVDKNASPEVIEKAYKALVKKFHPDLQPPQKKLEAETKLKLINEAYSVLSNKEKKERYDLDLKNFQNRQEQLKLEKLKKEYQNNFSKNSNSLKRQIKQPKINNTKNNNSQNLYNQEINRAYQQAYNDAYIKALKNMGYEIKYQKTFKDYFRIFLFFIFLIVLFFILWHIPFIKNFLLDLYNSNEIIKVFVDFIINIVSNIISQFK